MRLTVCLNVSCHTVDNVGDGNTRVGAVGAVVDDGGVIDRAITDREHAFIPMHMSRHVQVDTVLEEETLESVAHGFLVARNGSRVHGTVGAGNDPGCLRTVDSGKVGLHPLVLLVRLVVEGVVTPALDEAEWAGVVGECLGGHGSGVLAVGVGEEV